MTTFETFYIALRYTLEEISHLVLICHDIIFIMFNLKFKALINGIKKNATKLLHILLFKTLARCPMETFGQTCSHSK